jgi:hypothetical protein
MQPYALAASEGQTVEYGIPFLIKLGECAHGRGIAMVQYTTRSVKSHPNMCTRRRTRFFTSSMGD